MNQGFNDLDRMQFGSPSLMASPDITPNFTGWNSLSHEVSISYNDDHWQGCLLSFEPFILSNIL